MLVIVTPSGGSHLPRTNKRKNIASQFIMDLVNCLQFFFVRVFPSIGDEVIFSSLFSVGFVFFPQAWRFILMVSITCFFYAMVVVVRASFFFSKHECVIMFFGNILVVENAVIGHVQGVVQAFFPQFNNHLL